MEEIRVEESVEQAYADALDWLEANWDPEATVREWWVLLAESGWGFPYWPKEHFGRGLTQTESEGVRRAFRKVGALPPPYGLGQSVCVPMMLAYANEEQKREWIPLLARGEHHWCQFFSEPGSGSDLASVQTKAERDGDEWVINGQKVWTSGALHAARGMLLARTDPDVPKHAGISFFIIDVDQPGIEIRPLHQMNGDKHFNEVFFTDARVVESRLVSSLGNGWACAKTVLANERLMPGLPSVYPGEIAGNLDRPAGECAIEAARPLASRGRRGVAQLTIDVAKQVGPEVTADPVHRQALADVYVWDFATTHLRSAPTTDPAVRAVKGPMTKLARTQQARRASQAGMSALGAAGMLDGEGGAEGGSMQYFALSTPGFSIGGGTDEIQRNVVSEQGLGMPKDTRNDTNVPFRDLKVGTQRDS